ncbi:MAG: TIGR02646 family protein [Planctomycetaceae bacterium]|jgi:uncharacterized protein (TIGR02646 family)|nr:TIGR02646 family protein [Planctomycetaceae bacterium]
MKHIIKNNNKNTQNLFKRWQRRGGWNADNSDNKAKELKQKIKNLLLTEQGEICCYCEERITMDNSHIEHLKPKGKSEFAHLISNYENLFCSCNYVQSCGKKKDENVILVSPLDENCEDLFTFSERGQVIGKNQNAHDTIQILNLNSERFKSARNKIIETFIEDIDKLSDISLSEFNKWITDYLSQKPFVRFWTTVKWASEQYRFNFK